MKKTIYTVCMGMLASSFAIAQDTVSVTKDEGKFTVSGYIDSYYQNSFQGGRNGNIAGPTGYGRAFDKVSNQFALGLVQTKFTYINKKSEMVIDLTFGPNAALGNFGAAPSLLGYINPNAGGGAIYSPDVYRASMAIKQAYFKYNATDKLSFTIGQFGTHIGYEVIDAPVNYNYSLSNLFNNGPFYHIGAKANYAFSDRFGIMAGVVNNWDNLYDWKTQKSGIAQVFISPASGFNIYLNWIGGYGDDQFKLPTIAGGPSVNYTRNLFDITAGFQVTDKLYFGVNAAYGFYTFIGDSAAGDKAIKDGNNGKLTKDWYGIAAYSNYQLTDFFGIGVRYEHYSDKNRVRYFNTVNNSITITTPITLADGHLIIKPELRHDVSPDEVYFNADGSTRRMQTTIGCAFIYKY